MLTKEKTNPFLPEGVKSIKHHVTYHEAFKALKEGYRVFYKNFEAILGVRNPNRNDLCMAWKHVPRVSVKLNALNIVGWTICEAENNI